MRPGRPSGVTAVAALLAVLLVGACATPDALPSSVATAAKEPASAIARAVAPPRVSALHWTFAAAADMCTAQATGQGGMLQVQTDARQITVTLRFPAVRRAAPHPSQPATLRFSGAAGAWSVPGTWQHPVFSSRQHLDERGVASVLGLLGGGNATIDAGRMQLGAAQVPSASVAGSDWAQCPKQMMAPS